MVKHDLTNTMLTKLNIAKLKFNKFNLTMYILSKLSLTNF